MNHKTHTQTLRLSAAAAFLLCAVGLVNAQTSNSVVTFSVDMSVQVTAGTFVPGTDTVAARGTFNGWNQFFLTNNPSGANPYLYSGTTTDSTDVNGAVMLFKYWNSNPATPTSGYETPADAGKNRAVNIPSASGASLVLPTVFFSDAGYPVNSDVTFRVDMAQQINLGYFIPGTDSVYARGDWDNFLQSVQLTNDPSILRTNQFGLVSSNVYVGTATFSTSPNASETFKYWNNDPLAPGTGWETPSPVNANTDHDNNRFFFCTNQTLPIVFYSDAPYAPAATNLVTFQVDMSALMGGLFQPDMDRVDVRGSFNGWSGNVNICTNDPNAANTNIYSTQVTIIDGVGATEQYKFVYTGPNVPGGISWDQPAPPTVGGNRFFVQPNTNQLVLPPVYFSDVLPNSVVPTNTAVTFNVNMTGAKSYTSGTPFNPASDQVYVYGDFLGWGSAWDTGTLAPYQMTENPVGSTNYTITLTVFKGNPVNLTYKYGFYSAIDMNSGSVDNEAGFQQNHFRYVRQAPSYTMPTDVFGNQYDEPVKFGNLSAAPSAGRQVAVSWLGLPGVHLQTRNSVVAGAWTDLFNTDGTNYTAGYISKNGFVSVTNYPTTGGQTYFRLVQPGK
jgi:hypothetical protein